MISIGMTIRTFVEKRQREGRHHNYGNMLVNFGIRLYHDPARHAWDLITAHNEFIFSTESWGSLSKQNDTRRYRYTEKHNVEAFALISLQKLGADTYTITTTTTVLVSKQGTGLGTSSLGARLLWGVGQQASSLTPKLQALQRGPNRIFVANISYIISNSALMAV